MVEVVSGERSVVAEAPFEHANVANATTINRMRMEDEVH
jgi:hypothetical protein